MYHYVYIIHSEKYDKYYKGYSLDTQKRLRQHNNAESHYTAKFVPWKLVYMEKFIEKKQALIREKKLKKYSKNQILQIMKSPKNLLK